MTRTMSDDSPPTVTTTAAVHRQHQVGQESGSSIELVHSSQHCLQDDDDGGHGHPTSSPVAASSKFNGILLEYPDIAIDHFAIAPQTSSISLTIPPTIFILTHSHSDHTQGLAHLPKGTQVHTSAATARWITAYLDPALDHIDFVTHALNQPFKLRLSATSKKASITFLDAHHCLGAVSVLVQSKAGPTILHTGDFRFSQDMQNLWTSPLFLPSILSNSSSTSIDRIYMDTTFLGIRGPRDLASALEYSDKLTAINAVTLPSRSILSRTTRYFVRDCQLGHEPLLMALFNRFGYVLELSPAMYAAYASALSPFTACTTNNDREFDPIPWARPWPSPTALPAWLRPNHQPNVIHVCDSPCRTLCRRTFYRISQGHVPESLHGASFGWIKACAQAFIRSQRNHNAPADQDGPPLFFNYSRQIPNSPSATATTQVVKVWIAQHSSVPELNRFLQLVKPKQAVSTTAATSRDWAIFGEWIARQPGGIECPSRFLGSTRKGIRFSDLQRMVEGRRKSSGSSSVVEVEQGENVDPFELALALSDDEESTMSSPSLSQDSSEQSHVEPASALQDTLDISEWIEQQRRHHHEKQQSQSQSQSHASQASAQALESMFALPPSDDGPDEGQGQSSFPTPPPSDRRRRRREKSADRTAKDGWEYSSSEADEFDLGNDGDEGWFETRSECGAGSVDPVPDEAESKSMEERVFEHWRDKVHGKTYQLLHRLHMALLVQGREYYSNADPNAGISLDYILLFVSTMILRCQRARQAYTKEYCIIMAHIHITFGTLTKPCNPGILHTRVLWRWG